MFLYECKHPARLSPDQRLKKLVPIHIYLQPLQGSKIRINGKKVPFKEVRVDKTLGLIEIRMPLYRDRSGFSLVIENRPFASVKRKVFLQGQQRHWLRHPPVFVLDKKNSTHRFRHYWRTGKQPKSVTFIGPYRVAIPLLDDPGIDIIHILKGKIKRLQPPPRYSRLGGFVEALVLKKRKELWVSQMYTHSIHLFELERLRYIRTIPLSGRWVKVMVYDDKRNRVYASNWNTKDISVINVYKNKEIKRITAGGVPRGLFLSKDRRFLYVALYGRKNDADRKGRLIKIDLSQDKIVKTSGEFGSKRHFAYSEKTDRLFLSDMKLDRIEVYSPQNDSLLNSIRVYDNPNTIAIDPITMRYLYVSCRGRNGRSGYLNKGPVMGRINVIDLAKNRIVEEWEAGNQPTGLDISPNGQYVVSSDFLDHAIRVYERL